MEGKKIMIVDDDPRNIFALVATLKSRKFETQSCYSAEEALQLVNKLEPDIVLLDMMMPDMDGYEAIPKFKEYSSVLPVIAVTAQAMTGDKEKCLAAGADDYISKPIDVDKLMDLLASYLK